MACRSDWCEGFRTPAWHRMGTKSKTISHLLSRKWASLTPRLREKERERGVWDTGKAAWKVALLHKLQPRAGSSTSLGVS